MKKLLSAAMLLMLLTTPAHAATFKKEPAPAGQRYQYIYMEDVIGPGDDVQLEKLLSETVAAGNFPIVVMTSRGGDVDISMVMGRAIRRYGAYTYHGYCASSCVFAFLGGVQRYSKDKDGDTLLSVHRPILAENYLKEPTQGMYKVLMTLHDYIVEMTESEELYTIMMQIPFNEPRYFTVKEARSTKATTQFYK